MTRSFTIALVAAALIAPAAAQESAAPAAEVAEPVAAPTGPRLALELNRLEDTADACRAYFIIDNGLDRPVETLQLDTFLFGPDGVIAQRAALTFKDVRAAREKVALFDFAIGCAEIGRFLVNDILACETPAGPVDGCGGMLAVSSRAEAPLDY